MHNLYLSLIPKKFDPDMGVQCEKGSSSPEDSFSGALFSRGIHCNGRGLRLERRTRDGRLSEHVGRGVRDRETVTMIKDERGRIDGSSFF